MIKPDPLDFEAVERATREAYRELLDLPLVTHMPDTDEEKAGVARAFMTCGLMMLCKACELPRPTGRKVERECLEAINQIVGRWVQIERDQQECN